MKRSIVNDSPIENPDNDLLGVNQSAQVLANYLKTVAPPFVLGVYGQWGEGKTSFVDMMHYHLIPPGSPADSNVCFTTLLAWPYTNADELWRALIQTIIDALCPGPADPSTSQPPKPAPTGWLAAFSNFLGSSALPLYRMEEKKAEEKGEDEVTCEELRSLLDRGVTHSISRQSDNSARINQDAAMSALMQGLLAALSTVSPLVAGISRLFKPPPPVQITELFQKEKSVAINQNVKSVQDMQKDFKKYFSKIAKKKRLYVFIDDLDRCLPNVALDLLEAIRNFLPDVNCIFIIAADESLIGQGLRLRYKDMFESGDRKRTEAYLSQKGQEFFEKIIQFGVRVPARTSEQTHAFIAAQFPQWMPATDIIQTAIGNNPRRLKQYCNLLSFKYTVSQEQAGPTTPSGP